MISPITTIETIAEMREWSRAQRSVGLSIGLVPTMGYLHEGHLSLVERALEGWDRVVVSIFVNPTQFGPNEDLARYPRDLERDTALCHEFGADVIFHPSVEEMYPSGAPRTTVSVSGVTDGLCGRSRPTHFAGVATVVTKLFNIVRPDRAYFGEKDYQQLAAIRTLVRDLDLHIEIIGRPIVREPDGLAMSSRNAMLSAEERAQAPVLYRALCAGRDLCLTGEPTPEEIKAAMLREINLAPLAEVDYVEIVSLDALAPVDTMAHGALLAVAVQFGATRLIDNVVVAPA